MVERNEVGRMIRRYFIQKEKEVRGERLTLPNKTSEQIFKGLKPLKVNDRITYPFRKFLMSVGSSKPGGTQYYYVKNYPGHVMAFDETLYISRELAVQIYYTRSLRTVRKANKTMQPVLPLSFADAKPLNQGGSHE